MVNIIITILLQISYSAMLLLLKNLDGDDDGLRNHNDDKNEMKMTMIINFSSRII